MLSRMFALAIALTIIVGAARAQALAPEREAAAAAVAYIQAQQQPDGGFPGFGGGSAPGSTIDALFALVAAGVDPAEVMSSGNSPIDYLEVQAAAYSATPSAAAKLAFAVGVLELDATDFGGVNLLAVMDGNVDLTTGAYGTDLFGESLYLLALSRMQIDAPAATIDHLLAAQVGDGGWEFAAGFGSDTNTTAMVLQALLGAGVPPASPAIDEGLAYLHSVQTADGAFAFFTGAAADANSTGLVTQALVAAGELLDAGGPWAPGGNTVLDGLLSFRNPATGAFQFAGEDSLFATVQAVPGLLLAPFPDLETRTPPPVGGISRAADGAYGATSPENALSVLDDGAGAACEAATQGHADGATAGTELHHAGLVVVFPDEVVTRCVPFTEEAISGADLLLRSGLDVTFSDFPGLGGAVCKIEDVGCSDPANCFCQCQGGPCTYWGYFISSGDGWQTSGVGASQRQVHDGDMDGWVWGSGATPPDEQDFSVICPAGVGGEAELAQISGVAQHAADASASRGGLVITVILAGGPALLVLSGAAYMGWRRRRLGGDRA